MPAESRLAWYPWFPSDFLAETRGWPALARGLYRELLDAQWTMGGLPPKPGELRCIVQYTSEEWRQAWRYVKHHFPERAGRRRNDWLEAQRQEAAARYERRRAAGLRGTAVRWGSRRDGNAMAGPSQCDPVANGDAVATTTTITVPTPQQRDQRRTVVVAPRGAAR
jgi:uncharacterized protein YdaU (DUF1376 family)